MKRLEKLRAALKHRHLLTQQAESAMTSAKRDQDLQVEVEVQLRQYQADYSDLNTVSESDQLSGKGRKVDPIWLQNSASFSSKLSDAITQQREKISEYEQDYEQKREVWLLQKQRSEKLEELYEQNLNAFNKEEEKKQEQEVADTWVSVNQISK